MQSHALPLGYGARRRSLLGFERNHDFVRRERGNGLSSFVYNVGAANETRTRYLHLGKVALYQMSYGRIYFLLKEKVNKENFNRGPSMLTDLS